MIHQTKFHTLLPEFTKGKKRKERKNKERKEKERNGNNKVFSAPEFERKEKRVFILGAPEFIKGKKRK